VIFSSARYLSVIVFVVGSTAKVVASLSALKTLPHIPSHFKTIPHTIVPQKTAVHPSTLQASLPPPLSKDKPSNSAFSFCSFLYISASDKNKLSSFFLVSPNLKSHPASFIALSGILSIGFTKLQTAHSTPSQNLVSKPEFLLLYASLENRFS
jgi:hypothetical protein